MTLDELIRDTVARGELVHLSVSASPSGKGFSASYGPASGFGITIIHNADPVAALHEAITTTRLRRRKPAQSETTNLPS